MPEPDGEVDSAFLRFRPGLQRLLTLPVGLQPGFFGKQTASRDKKNFHDIAKVIAVLRHFRLQFRFSFLIRSDLLDARATLSQACPQAGKILMLQRIQTLFLQTLYDRAESTVDEPQIVRSIVRH